MKIVPGMQYGNFTILYQSHPNYIVVQCNNCSNIHEIKLGSETTRCKNCNPKTKIYEYNGKQYTSEELAKLVGCSVNCMRTRLHNHSVEDAVNLKVCKSDKNVLYTYKNKQYTVKQLAELAGCSLNAMRSRLRRNYSIEEVVEGRFVKGRGIEDIKLYNYKGKEYTINELAQLVGCNCRTMQKKIQNSSTIEEAVEKDTSRYTGKTYTYKGKGYTTKQLADIAGCSYRAISKRLQYCSVEEAVEKDGKRPVNKFNYKGKEYTAKQLAELTGWNINTIRMRIRKGYSIEEIVKGRPRVKNNNKKLYTYKNNQYTIDELAELADCTPIAMRGRLRNHSVEESVQFGKMALEKKYNYKGKIYTIKELAQLANCSPAALKNRINKGYSIEEAVEKSFKQSSLYNYKGKQYTLKELSEIAGCKKKTLYARIYKGHSIEEAVAMGPSKKDKQ